MCRCFESMHGGVCFRCRIRTGALRMTKNHMQTSQVGLYRCLRCDLECLPLLSSSSTTHFQGNQKRFCPEPSDDTGSRQQLCEDAPEYHSFFACGQVRLHNGGAREARWVRLPELIVKQTSGLSFRCASPSRPPFQASRRRRSLFVAMMQNPVLDELFLKVHGFKHRLPMCADHRKLLNRVSDFFGWTWSTLFAWA